MIKNRGNLCRYVVMVLCLLITFTVLSVPVAASETKTDTESKTVRVGWYPDSYHITGENGERSGYGYEYKRNTGIRMDEEFLKRALNHTLRKIIHLLTASMELV